MVSVNGQVIPFLVVNGGMTEKVSLPSVRNTPSVQYWLDGGSSQSSSRLPWPGGSGRPLPGGEAPEAPPGRGPACAGPAGLCR